MSQRDVMALFLSVGFLALPSHPVDAASVSGRPPGLHGQLDAPRLSAPSRHPSAPTAPPLSRLPGVEESGDDRVLPYLLLADDRPSAGPLDGEASDVRMTEEQPSDRTSGSRTRSVVLRAYLSFPPTGPPALPY